LSVLRISNCKTTRGQISTLVSFVLTIVLSLSVRNVGDPIAGTLCVFSGQQDHGGLVRALNIGTLRLISAGGGEHIPRRPLITSHQLGDPTKGGLPMVGHGSLLLTSG